MRRQEFTNKTVTGSTDPVGDFGHFCALPPWLSFACEGGMESSCSSFQDGLGRVESGLCEGQYEQRATDGFGTRENHAIARAAIA